jgi:heme A synthase
MTVAGSGVDLLFLPTWAALALYLVTIPLGLLVGALALRGFGRSDRRTARLLAVGLVLLTTVDALLGLTVGVGSVTVFERVPGIVREMVQLLGICCILYAIYVPTRRTGDEQSRRGQPDDETTTGGDDR